MKKRKLVTIATISIALILVGGVSYAAERKKQAKQKVRPPQLSEEEALKKELLAATEEHQKAVGEVPAGDKGADRTVTPEDPAKG